MGVGEIRLVTRGDADGMVITVAGEIDLYTAPQLRDAINDALAAGGDRIEVDFADVTFCDCSGLSVLIQARRKAQVAGAELAVVNARAPIVAKLFRLTRMGRLLGLSLAAAA